MLTPSNGIERLRNKMEKTVSARYLPEENPALQIQVDARHQENWIFPRSPCICS
jgi:hypothetical protein